jgi:hypothetical protein
MPRVLSLVLPLAPSLLVGLVLYTLWLAPPSRQRPFSALAPGDGGNGGGGMGDMSVLALPSVTLDGVYENIAGVEFVWQMPPEPKTPIVGVLLLCHSCHHGALDWWPPPPPPSPSSSSASPPTAGHAAGSSCPKCAGLPVETGIVSAGLARGYAVVAVTSRDRERRCWRERHDLRALGQAVSFVRKAAGLPEGSPLAALGFGSGGRMVTLLDEGGSGPHGSGHSLQGAFKGLVGVVSVASVSGKDPHAIGPSGHWMPHAHAPVRFL